MAGTKKVALAERNRRICLLRRNGFTYGEIAQMEQISRVRVSQIVAEHMAEIGEDEGRAEVAGILEFAERKAVGLVNAPGWKMRPDGRPAEGPDGEAAPDNGIVVEALKILVLVGEKKSRLYGWDKQQKKQPDEFWQQQMQASLNAIAAAKAAQDEAQRQEVERLRQQARTVAGQVVREIEPPQPPA